MRRALRYGISVALYVAAFLFIAIVVTISKAHAHEWYTETQVQEPSWYSGRGCCNGNDCAAVPLEADWVEPAPEGLHVLLSLEESRLVNPASESGIDEIFPWSRVQTPPKEAKGPAIYHLCISSYRDKARSRIYCLFAVPST